MRPSWPHGGRAVNLAAARRGAASRLVGAVGVKRVVGGILGAWRDVASPRDS